MASVFTLIRDGDLPAHFVYRDETCAAFMPIEPVKPGHTLVVPTEEVDHWLDLDVGTMAHLSAVSQQIGKPIKAAYSPTKVAMMVIGLEVPHAHIHLIPINSEVGVNFRNAVPASTDELAAADKNTVIMPINVPVRTHFPVSEGSVARQDCDRWVQRAPNPDSTVHTLRPSTCRSSHIDEFFT